MPRAAELTPDSRLVDVIVGILRDPAGRVLIGQRRPGTHMAGAWEFPGGKLEATEAPLDGLRRELEEELGIVVNSAEPLLKLRHSYSDCEVRLDVWWVLSYDGDVEPRESQVLSWVFPESLSTAELLPADAPIVDAIVARITG